MKLSVCIILICVYKVESLRILSVLATATKSHYAPTRRIILELARRGHDVVSISPYKEDSPPENFKWIPVEISSIVEAVPEIKEATKSGKKSFLTHIPRIWRYLTEYAKYITKLPKLKDFIENDTSKFDIILAEDFFQPVFYAFAYKYNAPLIIISTFGPAHFISDYMGNPLELSYVPHEFNDLYNEFSFIERLENLFFSLYDVIGRKLAMNKQNEIVKEVFKGLKGVPNVLDIERNASLVFLNSHFSLSVVRPYLPNMIEVGGVHIEDVKPLNQEIKSILDDAKDGAILLSLGSNLELALQPDDFVTHVLNTVGALKQRVVLKWNSDKKLPVHPKNVYPFKWLPQNDLLAHPKVVLFITHGGLLSSQEAIHHGVPIVCIPFYGDQHLNCLRSERMGYGQSIHPTELISDSFRIIVNEVLTNPKYITNAKEISTRFRDRPNSALDTAIYWVEHCARHKGMLYAQGPRRNLYWFQYYFVDLILCLLVIIWITIRTFKSIVNRFKKVVKVKTN